MSTGDEIIISNSTLKAVGTCDTEDVLRYGFRLTGQEERAELRAGNAVDAAVSAHFRGKPEKFALALFDAEYEEFARANVVSGDRLAFDNVRMITRRWIKKNPLEGLAFEIVAVQVKFNLELAPGIRYMGIMDARVKPRGQSEIQPLDTKTTGSWITGEKWPRQFGFEAQLTSYAWAEGEISGTVPSAIWINAVQLSKLPSSDRRCDKHAMAYSACGKLHAEFRILGPLSRKVRDVESWKRDAIVLAKRHALNLQRYPTLEDVQAKAPQQGRYTGRCTYCTFFKFCAAGRQPRHAKSMLLQMDEREIFAEGIESKEVK